MGAPGVSASPLAGLLVVDLGRLLPGPLAARLLCDLGARVVKVEEPKLGDPVRLAPPFVDGESALAAMLLHGVESIALDLKREKAREVLFALLDRADVLLDTFRPGTLTRLGLDPDRLAERYPRLIHCSLTGWGQAGPYAHRAGHDLTYQAAAGSLGSTAAAPPTPTADLLGAWAALSSILAALYERERTGRGSRIDASLFDAAVHANLVGWAEEAGGPKAVGEPLALTGALPCYNVYRSADGVPLALAALEPHFWRRFCRVAGHGELRRLGMRRDEGAFEQVAAAIAERPAEEWEELAEEHDLPMERVRAGADAAGHPQTVRRGLLERGSGGLPRLGFPVVFGGARSSGSGPGGAVETVGSGSPGGEASRGEEVPPLGGDTSRLLGELGLEMSPRHRRKAGVGRRVGLRRWLAGWLADRASVD